MKRYDFIQESYLFISNHFYQRSYCYLSKDPYKRNQQFNSLPRVALSIAAYKRYS
jgi:hypothetical protein